MCWTVGFCNQLCLLLYNWWYVSVLICVAFNCSDSVSQIVKRRIKYRNWEDGGRGGRDVPQTATPEFTWSNRKNKNIPVWNSNLILFEQIQTLKRRFNRLDNIDRLCKFMSINRDTGNSHSLGHVIYIHTRNWQIYNVGDEFTFNNHLKWGYCPGSK
jgi:hypothetical protein